MDTRTPQQQALDALEEQVGTTFTTRQREFLDVVMTDETHEWGTKQHRMVEEIRGARANGEVISQAQQIWRDADKKLVDEMAQEREKIATNPALPTTRQQRRVLERRARTALRKAAKRDRGLADRLGRLSLDELRQLEAEVARLSAQRHG